MAKCIFRVKRGSRAVKRTKNMFSSKENEKRFTTICYTRRVGLLFRLFFVLYFVLSNNFYFLPVLGVFLCVFVRCDLLFSPVFTLLPANQKS